MTSYVREGRNSYNGVEAPQYNILSYTWGYYQDKRRNAPCLDIKGTDWSVPAIKESHFTVAQFENAIKLAARGIKHSCDWLWVDIACIPQEHDQESKEAKAMRDQEIGRQVEIFNRAKEAFAWFCSLKTTDLLMGGALPVTVDNVVDVMNELPRVQHDTHDVIGFLDVLEYKAQSLEKWMSMWLKHPWFSSLWTLQEMILRPDAVVLFDNGYLYLEEQEIDVSVRPWSFNRIKNDAWALRTILTDSKRMSKLRDAEKMAKSRIYETGLPEDQGQIAELRKRLQGLLDCQVKKGLTALKVTSPNTAYSMAQYRRVSKPLDVIFGIIQTYGISCKTNPAGEDDGSKLRSLQDDFGKQLVAKGPVMSQLFIHSLENGKPRRSWLITQAIKADDTFWERFSSEESTRNHYTKFGIPPDCLNGTRNLVLNFKGKAWHLSTFVEWSCPFASHNPPESQKNLFHAFLPGFPERYRGLMLDHHVSRTILGDAVDYFDDHGTMSAAYDLLHERYCGLTHSGSGCPALRVALLGSGFTHNVPVVAYVGVVLVPRAPEYGQLSDGSIIHECNTEHFQVAEPTEWVRIGLMRWTEVYHDSSDESLHYLLPPHHEFECDIV